MRDRRTLLLPLVLVVATTLGVVAYATHAFAGLERDSINQRFSVRGTQTPPRDLVVVQIDDASFDRLDLQWPFPRAVHARVIERIAADRPKVIAYDVQFSERSAPRLQQLASRRAARILGLSPARARRALAKLGDEDDLDLVNAILDTNGKTVLSFTETDRGKVNFLDAGPRPLEQIDARPGNGTFSSDPGAVIRRVDYAINGLKTLPVVAVEVAERRRVDPADFPAGGAWIDFYGGSNSLRTVSFSDVAQGRVPKGLFAGKLVVVGPSAPTLQDVHATSTTGADDEMAGGEIHASAIDTIRRGFPLRSVPGWVNVLAIVLAGSLTPLLSLRLPALAALAIALASGALYVLAAFVVFGHGHIVAFTYPLLTLAVSAVAALAVHYLTAAFERARTRDLFTRFVPEDVVGEVLKQAGGARLGGVGRTATVMFSDMRGFTSFSETQPPERVIAILNRYLTTMVDDAIDPHGGTLVAYMGDGIMAVFGAPLQCDDHADRALAAARAKLAALERFNAWLHEEMGFDKSFRMGIGLNTGPVTSGNVGSLQHMAYTTIGDTTNTAARLEAMTKTTPYMLLMSDATRAALSSAPDDLLYVDEVEVRGRTQKVKLWTVAASAGEGQTGDTFASVTRDPRA
jgi:adenylate cyclase